MAAPTRRQLITAFAGLAAGRRPALAHSLAQET
jgi:hypothetical protein